MHLSQWILPAIYLSPCVVAFYPYKPEEQTGSVTDGDDNAARRSLGSETLGDGRLAPRAPFYPYHPEEKTESVTVGSDEATRRSLVSETLAELDPRTADPDIPTLNIRRRAPKVGEISVQLLHKCTDPLYLRLMAKVTCTMFASWLTSLLNFNGTLSRNPMLGLPQTMQSHSR